MSEMVLLGQGHKITEIPRTAWEKHLVEAPKHMEQRLSFMTDAHHLVRNFVVKELPRRGKPIDPETISSALKIPRETIGGILDELERQLFFLVRNEQGFVTWTYPVTVEPTPHSVSFNTGERFYGA
jgi:hypothetical protein